LGVVASSGIANRDGDVTPVSPSAGDQRPAVRCGADQNRRDALARPRDLTRPSQFISGDVKRERQYADGSKTADGVTRSSSDGPRRKRGARTGQSAQGSGRGSALRAVREKRFESASANGNHPKPFKTPRGRSSRCRSLPVSIDIGCTYSGRAA